MTYAETILPEFDQEMASTRKVLERIPQDKLEWQAHPKSHTIGWNANHLADLPNWLVVTLTQPSLDIAPVGGEPYKGSNLTSRDEILGCFDRNVADEDAAGCRHAGDHAVRGRVRAGHPFARPPGVSGELEWYPGQRCSPKVPRCLPFATNAQPREHADHRRRVAAPEVDAQSQATQRPRDAREHQGPARLTRRLAQGSARESWPGTLALSGVWVTAMFLHTPLADRIATRLFRRPPMLKAFCHPLYPWTSGTNYLDAEFRNLSPETR